MSRKIPMKDINIVEDKPLKKEQIEAIQFMLKRKSCIVSLQTGLGKTLASLTAMEHLKRILGNRLLTLIIAPKNAIISFSNELENFKYTDEYEYFGEPDTENYLEKKVPNTKRIGRILSGEYSVLDLNSNDSDDIIMVSYSKIKDNLDDIIDRIYKHKINKDNIVLAIFDEAHILSNHKTETTKNCLQIRKFCDIVWGLTATPIKNKYEMVYHICNFIRPKYVAKSFAEFMRNFCETKKVKKYFSGRTIWMEEIIGRKNEDELKTLLDDLIIVREIEYNINYKYIPIQLDDTELDMYDEVASDRLGDGRTQFSTRCIELQKLLDNVLDVEIVNMSGDVIYTKKYKFKSKEDRLVAIINKLIEKGHTPIIYTDFIDTVERLVSLFSENHTVHTIIGDTNPKNRRRIEEEMKQGDITIITSAGTASLNLQKANTIVFYNVPYSSVNVIQAIGRVTRLGSAYKTQNVIFLYCLGTIDEYKIKYFKSNSARISSLIGKSSNLPDDLNEMDKVELRDLKGEILWQYRTKKNKVRRVRRKALKERLLIESELPNNELETEYPVYNLTGESLKIFRKGKWKKLESSIDETYGKALKDIENVGYYKSKLRELFEEDDKILKLYFIIVKEGKFVTLVDNPKYRIAKYMKMWMIENWRILEEGVSKL